MQMQINTTDIPVLPLRESERLIIQNALIIFSGNKVKTAQALGISLKTLYNKLNRYNREGETYAIQSGSTEDNRG